MERTRAESAWPFETNIGRTTAEPPTKKAAIAAPKTSLRVHAIWFKAPQDFADCAPSSGCSSLFFPVVPLRFFVSLDPNAEPEAKQHRYQGGRHRGLLRETLELGITDDRRRIPAQQRIPVLYLRAQVRDLPSPAMARAASSADAATFVRAQCAVPTERHWL